MLHKILLQPEVALLEVSDVVYSTCLQSSHGLNDFSDVMHTLIVEAPSSFHDIPLSNQFIRYLGSFTSLSAVLCSSYQCSTRKVNVECSIVAAIVNV